MTDADWQACADVTAMLTHIEGRVSHRKLRLFAVACCERIWALLPDAISFTRAETLRAPLQGAPAAPAPVSAWMRIVELVALSCCSTFVPSVAIAQSLLLPPDRDQSAAAVAPTDSLSKSSE